VGITEPTLGLILTIVPFGGLQPGFVMAG